MANISWNEIQDRAAEFASKWQGETYEKGESQSFWSDFLNIFDIDRRRHGAYFEYAIKKGSGKQGFIDMFWPGKLLAEQKSGGKDLSKANIQAYEYLSTMPDHDLPEAIVISDFATFQFIDLETRNKTEFSLLDLPKNVKLFGFLLGQTSKNIAEQDPVNRQVAEAMADLHNQLRDDNYTGHDLELLLVRLVFLMFADDSGIFDRATILEYVENCTAKDGSDLGSRLVQIFEVLNTPKNKRQNSLDEAMATLPYVNGGLFAEYIQTPTFNSAMRHTFIDAMHLDWSKVSPAIFGSMFQGVMDETERRNLGAHYTSEKNILRVIKPLFLDDLYVELARAVQSGPRKKYDELRKLQDKISQLKFLDPACGSGNFLVIAYRELRRLEHKIVAMLAKDPNQQDMFASAGAGVGVLKVNVDQMCGIEIDEFPSLIAQTALWLTDHQMNVEYSQQSGRTFKRLPLTKSATIVNKNALTTDWSDVIPAGELDYILGNPPFIGSKMMTATMRDELLAQFPDVKGAGVLDFVTAWYAKAANYMKQNPKIQTALVSTNSIIQGEQVPILWKYLFEQGVAINFLHQTFKWSNDAKGNAAVYCTIVGFALFNKPEKRIFEYEDIKGEPNEIQAKNINGYGIDAPSVIIERRGKPICAVPPMSFGNMPLDGGNLLLAGDEKDALLDAEPAAKEFIKPFIGAKEFLRNETKWCLWFKGASPTALKSLPLVLARVRAVKDFRLASNTPSTNAHAIRPAEFRDTANPEKFVVVPRVSSERREYVPMAIYQNSEIAGDTCQIISNATLYHFGILTSQMHMAWMRAVAGRLESRYRYSKDIVYNNFIWPEVTDQQKAEVERLAQDILDARAKFPDSSLADLYDPLTMPPTLAKAHKTLDRYVDRLYQKSGFQNDPARVAHLFELYKENG
ncbi:class I SAM-dependent DNA methyltransferase [Candidatus Nomurabacteria bacterium]|nr:class I SAM-dependent DNA methyltransferase [Candidatus Nomurabacteria bacterium]